MSVTEVPPGCLTGSHFLEGDIPDPLGKGARAVKFIEMLQLTEGAFAGRRFKLDTWQERLVRKVYGDLGPTGLRKVRTVFVLIPRGNGKTCFASALALLGLFGPEREAAGQVISAAADRQQASICYNSAARVAQPGVICGFDIEPGQAGAAFEHRYYHGGRRARQSGVGPV